MPSHLKTELLNITFVTTKLESILCLLLINIVIHGASFSVAMLPIIFEFMALFAQLHLKWFPFICLLY
jgi:hypothetical protein